MKKRTISIGMILCMILSLITGVGYSVSGGETQAAKKKKVLVVYFTRADNVQSKKALDASSSASIQISGKKRFGNAEMLARKIRKQTGGDIRSMMNWANARRKNLRKMQDRHWRPVRSA